MKKLAKIETIPLREIWDPEPEFSSWLSRQESLDLLGEEIGLSIKPIKTEADVGKFRVDILAEEEGTGRKIVIENQLEDTNHDHLGKIITYASGYDAEIIIWIVRDTNEPHQRAIEWLNEHTDEKIGFFLIKVELLQIENSNPAPKFYVLASPNEWAKTTKESSSGGALNQTKIQQLEFWTKFRDFVKDKDSSVRLQTPRPRFYYDISMGFGEAHIALLISSKNGFSCGIWISKNKKLFNFLQTRKTEIEKEIPREVAWIDYRVASTIRVHKHVLNLFEQKKAQNYFEWFYENMVLFKKIFPKYFEEFRRIDK